MIDFDLDAAADAFATKDDPAFAAATAPLGLALDVTLLGDSIRVPYSANRRRMGKLALVALYRVLVDEVGVALERDDGGTSDRFVAAAVRFTDRIIIGVTIYGHKCRNGFEAITRWYKDTARNREIMVSWATSEYRATTIPIRRPIAKLGDADHRGAELLAAVLAAPDDDAPRLVYADWLLERGDPQGELIHLECASAPTEALVARAVQLRTLCHANFGKLVGGRGYTTRRGFIDEVTLTVAALARHGAALMRAHPIRRFVVEVGNQDQLRKLAKSPPPPPAGIRIAGHQVMSSLLDLPAVATMFAGRTELDFERVDVPPQQWSALFRDPACASVCHLRLSMCQGIDETLVDVLGAGALPALVSLKLDRIRWFEAVSVGALRALGARLQRIAELDWRDPDGFRRAYHELLAGANLVEIDNQRSSHADHLAEVLAASPGARSLRTLAVNLRDPATLATLLTADTLRDLRELRVLPRPSSGEIPAFAEVVAAHARPGLRIDWWRSPELSRN